MSESRLQVSNTSGIHARRVSAGAGRGKLAWDKERTRELFALYKNEGDEDAREQLIVSHLNLVR